MEQSRSSKVCRKQARHQDKPTASSSSKGKTTSLSSGSNSSAHARTPFPKLGSYAAHFKEAKPSTHKTLSYAGVVKNNATSKNPPTSALEALCVLSGPQSRTVTSKAKVTPTKSPSSKPKDQSPISLSWHTVTGKAKATSTKSSSTKPKDQCPVSPPWHCDHRPIRKSGRGVAGSPLTREDDTVGKYQVLETSAENLFCGKFSLEISTREQLGLEMTPKDFDRIRASEASRAIHEAKGWIGDNYDCNFMDEQLALVLYLFGLEHGKILELGLIIEQAFTFALPLPKLVGATAPEPNGAKPETVWIHNDNAEAIRRLSCNHYSGVKLIT